MIITPAAASDLDAILDLEENGFVAARWSRDSWADELSGHDRYVLAGRDVQGGRLIAVATFQRVADTADLHRIIVDPAFRGRGIAKRLVLAGLEWAQALGARRILLEVEPENAPAVTLYRAAGFEPIDRRQDYYGPGRDAIVMSRDLWVVVGEEDLEWESA